MKIRTKITLTFFLMVSLVLGFVSLSIYLSSAQYRQSDFTRRLKNRGSSTVKLLVGMNEITPRLLRKIDKDNPANLPRQFVAVYNDRDSLLYRSDDTYAINYNLSLNRRARQNGHVYFRGDGFEAIVFPFQHANRNLLVVAAAYDSHGLEALANLRNILLVTFLISLVIVSILAWIHSGRVLRPISEIVSEMDSITEANLHRRLKKAGSDEIGKLAATFNLMLDRLQQSFQAQKNFIANASHELRTPIAVMQAEVDASLLQPRDPEHYVEVLRSLHESIKGLNDLSTQLLLLAQASASLKDPSFTTLRIDEILWDAQKDVERINASYSVRINFDLSLTDDALRIAGDPQLLKALFVNLIDNGCKYSYDQSITVSLSKMNGSLLIDFCNSGIGIDPSESERIFEPFYRGKRSKSMKGFGIGLPLSTRIVKLHDGTLSVQSIPSKETVFTVSLPIVEQV